MSIHTVKTPILNPNTPPAAPLRPQKTPRCLNPFLKPISAWLNSGLVNCPRACKKPLLTNTEELPMNTLTNNTTAFGNMQNVGTCGRVTRTLLSVIAIEAVLLAPLSAPLLATLAVVSIYLAFTSLIGWDPVSALVTNRDLPSLLSISLRLWPEPAGCAPLCAHPPNVPAPRSQAPSLLELRGS